MEKKVLLEALKGGNVGFKAKGRVWTVAFKDIDDPYYKDDNKVLGYSLDRKLMEHFDIEDIDEVFLMDMFKTPLEVGDWVIKNVKLNRMSVPMRARIKDIKFTKKGVVTLEYFPAIGQSWVKCPQKNEPTTLISCNFKDSIVYR